MDLAYGVCMGTEFPVWTLRMVLGFGGGLHEPCMALGIVCSSRSRQTASTLILYKLYSTVLATCLARGKLLDFLY